MENPNIERAGWSDEDRPVKEEETDEDDDSADGPSAEEEDSTPSDGDEDLTTVEYLGH